MNTPLYICDLCNYSTILLGNYKKHKLTNKHMMNNYNNIKKIEEAKNKGNQLATITCHCGKNFKSRSGAWNHRKKCTHALPISTQASVSNANSPSLDSTVVMAMIKQTQEFKDFMMEHQAKQMEQQALQAQEFQNQLLQIAKTGINLTTNNNTITNNFNLNIFLNETCKEAINMQDFVKTLPITMNDLEETGKIGYTNGISRLFVNGLKILDVNRRPIHCSDFKREVVYIKDCDVWEKDGEEKNLIKQAIRMVESKNIKLIPQWANERPGIIKSDHKQNTQYLNIVCQSTGGDDNDDERNVNKIIKNILKEVRITK
jgi:hypothetical protein